MCACTHSCVCVGGVYSIHGSQKKTLGPLGLELRVAVNHLIWALRTKLGCSVRPVSSRNCCVISWGPEEYYFMCAHLSWEYGICPVKVWTFVGVCLWCMYGQVYVYVHVWRTKEYIGYPTLSLPSSPAYFLEIEPLTGARLAANKP